MKSVNDSWNERFIKLGNQYVDWYLSGQFELTKLANIPSHREVLGEVYAVLIRTKQLAPIESLTEAEKSEIWKDCKPFAETLFAKDQVKFCKCYWALSCLAQKRVA